MARFDRVDDYIASFPPATGAALEVIRQTIRRVAPTAEEGISYGIAAFGRDGRFVVWFAGWKRHVSLYPIPSADPGLTAELAPYLAAKGTLRFPLDQPMPLDLIARVAAALLDERLHRRS